MVYLNALLLAVQELSEYIGEKVNVRNDVSDKLSFSTGEIFTELKRAGIVLIKEESINKPFPVIRVTISHEGFSNIQLTAESYNVSYQNG